MKCPRCEKELKDVAAHIKRVHPEAAYLRPDERPPYGLLAEKITIDEWDEGSLDGSNHLFGEWHTERYGARRHGWFIPVEVLDNQPGMWPEVPDNA